MKRNVSAGVVASAVIAALCVGAPALGQLAPQSGPQPRAESYPTFYEVDADGMPIAPPQWVDVAAMTVNTTLRADQREAIEAGVREWLATVQKLVIENPDLVLEAAQGLFAEIDIDDRARLAYASEVMKGLATTGNLTSYLTTQGILTNEQGEFNRQIVQQYTRARSEALAQQVMAEAPEDQQRQMQLLVARTTMANLTDDAVRMFRSVAVRGAPMAQAAAEDAGLDASKYATELEAATSASGDQARVDAMIALMDAMRPKELFGFAEALGEKLPPVELPEISEIGSAQGNETDDG